MFRPICEFWCMKSTTNLFFILWNERRLITIRLLFDSITTSNCFWCNIVAIVWLIAFWWCPHRFCSFLYAWTITFYALTLFLLPRKSFRLDEGIPLVILKSTKSPFIFFIVNTIGFIHEAYFVPSLTYIQRKIEQQWQCSFVTFREKSMESMNITSNIKSLCYFIMQWK